jgi:type IV fimbrial biogenesis protein FimT
VTLIELMVTIVILAVLIGIGVPSFRNASLGARLGSVANDLLASIQLARSEAIKRNETVTLCTSTDGTTCAASQVSWEQGWVILNAAGNVLDVRQAIPGGYKVTRSGGTTAIRFQPIGIGATTATFTVCRSSPVGSQERVVTVNASGSAAVTITTAGSCS